MWPEMTEEVRDELLRLLKTSGPPASLVAAMGDDEWRPLFEDYLSRNHIGVTDIKGVEALNLFHFVVNYGRGLTGPQLAQSYFYDDAPMWVAWPDEVADGLERAGAGEEVPGLEDQMYQHALTGLEGWYAAFLSDISNMTQWLVSEAKAKERFKGYDAIDEERRAEDPDYEAPARDFYVGTTMTPDQLDLDYIDQVNAYSWAEAKDGGEVDFRYVSDPPILLIGKKNFAPAYWQALGAADRGVIRVRSRGRAFDAGSVEVEGSIDHDGFKRAFKKVSNKSVTFV